MHHTKPNSSRKPKQSQYNLFILQNLILVLPSLTIGYVFLKSNASLNLFHIFMITATVLLIFCGLLIIRQLFDKLLTISTLMKKAENLDFVGIQSEKSNLYDLTVKFEDMMNQFAQTSDELEHNVLGLLTIKELNEIARKSLDLDYLFNTLLEKSMKVSRAQIGSVFKVDFREKRLEIVASKGSESMPQKGTFVNFTDTPMEYILNHREPLLVKNIETDHRTQKPNNPKYGTPSFLCLPITVQDNIIGILNLSKKDNKAIFDENDEQLLSIMIGEIAFALENAILHSEAKKHAKNLLVANEQLQKEINEKKQVYEEKEKLKAQLIRSQKMEAIGTLASGVAHDLNNVLGGVISYPDLLLMQIPENSPLRRSILAIKKSGQKAADIVHDLLTLARRVHIVKKVANLNNIICEYLESPEFDKLKSFYPQVEIETTFEKNLFNTMGSPIHLTKMVMNLVSNAAEAMPSGGKIFISTENIYIDKTIGYESVNKTEGEYVTLKISDTGVGISPEDRERIFEPFYSKKVMGKSGTGLGMAIVWATIKDHKGYIDIQSSEEKGTIFTIYLPAARKELTEERSLLVKDYVGKGESILVVDDLEDQRDAAVSLLTSLGYSVDACPSGEEALKYLKGHPPVDLLLLDMIMDRGMDGLDTYKEILKIHPTQKAIIISGFSETERVKEAQRLGAGQYLMKPFTLEKLGMTVKSELESP